MPQPAASWSLTNFWRIAVVALSVALGAIAVCLVVFGTSQKQVQLGVLLGLWAALLAAYLVYGSHRAQSDLAPVAELEEARAQASELHQAQLKVATMQQEQLEAAKQAYFSQEIEFRQFGELQLAREAAARRESELNLERFLRRELERVMTSELGSLREEVAALRAEIVDKLGGQLRLERIETTRVIGSDLEALQNEIRRLAGTQPGSLAQSVPTVQPGSPAERVAPMPSGDTRVAEIVDAELVEFPPPPAIAQPRSAEPDPAGQSNGAEARAGRRRAPEPDPSQDPVTEVPRYQGRRRAEREPADW